MKSITKILMVITMWLPFTIAVAQIKNTKTETLKIYGNCDICKSAIEKAGSLKKIAQVNWNADTKMAVLSYDTTKTNQQEILKRIALAGYDSAYFLAPDDVYAQLQACCKYERNSKNVATAMQNNFGPKTETAQKAGQLQNILDNYFTLKDALLKSDGTAASSAATDLLNAVKAVKMETLSPTEHPVWMKIAKNISFDTEHISETKDVKHQRDHFTSLSENMYELAKVLKFNTAVYYQHCPMFNNGKGANWLSKDFTVKNPYYGLQMLTCGKTVETIK